MPRAKTEEKELKRRAKISVSKKGHPPSYRGGFKGPHTEEANQKNRLAHLGRCPWNKGQQTPKNVKEKVSLGLKHWWEENKATEKGESYIRRLLAYSAVYNPESKAKGIASLKRWWSNPNNAERIKSRKKAMSIGVKRAWEEGKYDLTEFVLRQSESQKALWRRDPERGKKCLGFRKPNKKELQFDKLLQDNFPNQWKYVGNGEITIGGKCPDWVNINGQKAVIELFGEYWHQEEEIPEKEKDYIKYGFRMLVIWSQELKHPQDVIQKVSRFIA